MRPAAVLLAAALALAAPRATSAAENCNVVNRGWLDGVFNERIHPTYLFGPGGLHGNTNQVPSASSLFSVEVLSPEAGPASHADEVPLSPQRHPSRATAVGLSLQPFC